MTSKLSRYYADEHYSQLGLGQLSTVGSHCTLQSDINYNTSEKRMQQNVT